MQSPVPFHDPFSLHQPLDPLIVPCIAQTPRKNVSCIVFMHLEASTDIYFSSRLPPTVQGKYSYDTVCLCFVIFLFEDVLDVSCIF